LISALCFLIQAEQMIGCDVVKLSQRDQFMNFQPCFALFDILIALAASAE
jgi:hypothetical protein